MLAHCSCPLDPNRSIELSTFFFGLSAYVRIAQLGEARTRTWPDMAAHCTESALPMASPYGHWTDDSVTRPQRTALETAAALPTYARTAHGFRPGRWGAAGAAAHRSVGLGHLSAGGLAELAGWWAAGEGGACVVSEVVCYRLVGCGRACTVRCALVPRYVRSGAFSLPDCADGGLGVDTLNAVGKIAPYYTSDACR